MTESRASTVQDASPVFSAGSEIVQIFLEEQLVSQDQVQYAQRVRSKLAANKTIVEILQELGYVRGEQVRTVLRKHHVTIRIGALLVELGYLKEPDLHAALNIQKSSPERKKLGDVLIEQGFIEEARFIEALSCQLGFPCVDPDFRKFDPALFTKAPIQKLRELCIIPLSAEGSEILVAFADPLDRTCRAEAEKLFGAMLRPAIASKAAILNALITAEKQLTRSGAEEADERTIIGIINALFDEAISANVSDIHIEPLKDRLRVRFRHDGIMVPHKELPLDLAPQLATRIKVLAQADIAEKRRHQDGRILYESHRHGFTLDIRASFYITIHGEKMVLRLLNRKGAIPTMDAIGMAPRMREQFIQDALDTPSGVIIITGPTGSGKTTTMYGCINYLNNINTTIITAEDPVEYVIDGICQCSINPKIGLTYEETLRHIVRQDPDIIVLGEIRDSFSAETAIQAALTGHKVLTTFHTEDSIGGLIRLMNMEIETFLISSTVVSVVAQRLLRLICPACAEPYVPTPQEFTRIGGSAADLVGSRFQRGRGCSHCRFTGFKGRTAIFELLVMNEAVKEAILNNRGSAEIRRLSIETSGLVTLFEDGLVKAAEGLVSLQEVLRDLPRITRPRPLHELKRILGT